MTETSDSGASQIVITLAHARTVEGNDVAAVIRSQLPDADIEAVLDERGAVREYRVRLSFGDPGACTEAAFRLRDLLAESGFSGEWR